MKSPGESLGGLLSSRAVGWGELPESQLCRARRLDVRREREGPRMTSGRISGLGDPWVLLPSACGREHRGMSNRLMRKVRS